MLDPALIFLVILFVAVIALPIKLAVFLEVPLLSFPIVTDKCYHSFVLPRGKIFPIFFQELVDDCCRSNLVLCFKDADLNIISRWGTVEKNTDVAGV